MVRLYLAAALLAAVVLIVLWSAKGPNATAAKWVAAAYLVAAAILLFLGVGM